MQTTTAAVLVEPGRPLEIKNLEIPDVRPGQVLVKIYFSGVCHTQILEAKGRRGHDRFLPHCLGHEGTGVVSGIGSGVSKVKVGDRVILSWIEGSGANVFGTVYKSAGKVEVNAGPITTFSEDALVSESRVTLLPENVSFKEGVLLGCAIPTGMGAIKNVACAKSGQSVAVFGSGGVGLCALSASVIQGCDPVIAVDVNREKLRMSSEIGSHYEVLSGKDIDPVSRIAEICPEGLDYAIDCTGIPEVMDQCLLSVRPRGGTVIVVGNAHFGQKWRLDPSQLNQGKRIMGTWGGDSQPDRDYLGYSKLISTGKFNCTNLLSKVYKLDQINEALSDLEHGRVYRPVIDMGHSTDYD